MNAKLKQAVPTIAVIVIFTIFGLGLILQSQRWHNTPSYANLLVLMPAWVWGFVYLGIAAVFAAAVLRLHRMTMVIAHVLAFVLLLSWEVAFMVRWATDSGTTIVNVVSWGTYLALVVYSARCIDTIEPESTIELA